ncbi:helix-turn-helix domain-containing protein [Halobacterium jilantaiense]|uniref:Uncharacterized protein n=1 Tax=Halobacterium jilantaiense TaxID=355548 RepID=A0A1I0PXM1_9EURY|nr:helix-turn-helix domain-containing protein [Halobacterium jilantaiense]SEW19298.1 hypothetical protein SAMN04487945_2071 [Halobacterium jilantaiense]
MGLSDIAAGVEVTTRQRERGVASVDRTAAPLADRLAAHADDLPCGPGTAAELAEAYASGGSVGDAAEAVGVAPTTAAKCLHRLGFEGLTPLSPLQRDILADWLDARLSRTEALELTAVSEREFALAAYVATHDRLPEAAEAVESALSNGEDAMVAKRDALAATLPESG